MLPGLRKGIVEIREVSDVESVNDILVRNRSDSPVLILDGEILTGLSRTGWWGVKRKKSWPGLLISVAVVALSSAGLGVYFFRMQRLNAGHSVGKGIQT